MGRNKTKSTKKHSSRKIISTSFCSICCRQFKSQSNRGSFRLRALHEQKCEAVQETRKAEELLSSVIASLKDVSTIQKIIRK